MRIHTNLSEDEREQVKDYARKNGLRMKRAYTELIRMGLKNIDRLIDKDDREKSC